MVSSTKRIPGHPWLPGGPSNQGRRDSGFVKNFNGNNALSYPKKIKLTKDYSHYQLGSTKTQNIIMKIFGELEISIKVELIPVFSFDYFWYHLVHLLYHLVIALNSFSSQKQLRSLAI